MKKIIILIPHTGIPHHLVGFAANFNKQESCHVIGLFLHEPKQPQSEDRQALDHSIKTFQQACAAEGIPNSTRVISENHVNTLVDETAFADLMLCSDDIRNLPYSGNFVSSAYCPVLFVPNTGNFPREIIFTYDGSISSIHAMKQFNYLFPWCKDHKVYLFSVVPIGVDKIEYDALVKEWLFLHYPNTEIVTAAGEVRSEIVEFVKTGRNNLVVMGAFGRSTLSRVLNESLSVYVINHTNAPVFIAHV
jgi:Universal stress protein UspA and related nucleotide-binding proteins